MPAFAEVVTRQTSIRLIAYLFHPIERACPAAQSRPRKRQAAVRTRRHYTTESGFGFMFTSSGLPAISPPWTSFTAYDLNEGTIKWKYRWGKFLSWRQKDSKTPVRIFPKTDPVVTAGGLIFAGTRDRKVRALDSETGKVLWEAQWRQRLKACLLSMKPADANIWSFVPPRKRPLTRMLFRVTRQCRRRFTGLRCVRVTCCDHRAAWGQTVELPSLRYSSTTDLYDRNPRQLCLDL